MGEIKIVSLLVKDLLHATRISACRGLQLYVAAVSCHDPGLGHVRQAFGQGLPQPPRAETLRMRMLGHSDIKQTQRHLDITAEELRRANCQSSSAARRSLAEQRG